jgi:hypothetical protein
MVPFSCRVKGSYHITATGLVMVKCSVPSENVSSVEAVLASYLRSLSDVYGMGKRCGEELGLGYANESTENLEENISSSHP